MSVTSDNKLVLKGYTSRALTDAHVTSERLFFLDLARAVAIAFVTSFHLWRFLGSESSTFVGLNLHRIVASGAIGVDIFFVISGFAMMLTWEKSHDRSGRVKKFLAARFWRIYPPYALAVFFWLLMAATFIPKQVTVGDTVAHLTFTHTLFPAYFFGISGVLWSLALEVHFYLLFPLIISVRVKHRIALGVATLIYAFVSTYYFPSSFPLRWNVLAYLPAFMLGMGLFSLRKSGIRLPTYVAAAAILAALFAMTILPVLGTAVFPRILLASAFAIPLLLWEPEFPSWLASPLSKVGLASYSIYLYNYIFQITREPIVNGTLGWIFYGALVVGVGYIMWWSIELRVPTIRRTLSSASGGTK